MIGVSREKKRRSTPTPTRSLIGIKGGFVGAVVLALCVSANFRARVVIHLADAWSLMSPPTLAAHEEAAVADEKLLTGRERQLLAENMRLRRALRTASPPLADPDSLIDVHAVAAQVLWTAGDGRDAVLSLASASGINANDLVLDDETPHIAAGSDEGVLPDALTLCGRCVVGRVQRTGSRSATLMPVTSPDFELDAELVRGDALDPVVGASGTYVGTGAAGQLTMVPVEEPVNVGDEVFTRPGSTWCAGRLSIGRVTAVESDPGEPHWRIQVRPHAAPQRHDVVTVLTPRLEGGPQ